MDTSQMSPHTPLILGTLVIIGSISLGSVRLHMAAMSVIRAMIDRETGELRGRIVKLEEWVKEHDRRRVEGLEKRLERANTDERDTG